MKKLNWLESIREVYYKKKIEQVQACLKEVEQQKEEAVIRGDRYNVIRYTNEWLALGGHLVTLSLKRNHEYKRIFSNNARHNSDPQILIYIVRKTLSPLSKENIEGMKQYLLQLTIPESITPGGILERAWPSTQFRRRISLENSLWRRLLGVGKTATAITHIEMNCPSIPELVDEPINKQGITNHTVFVVIKTTELIYDIPEDDPRYSEIQNPPEAIVVPVRSAKHFQHIVKSEIKPFKIYDAWSPILYAALLYTDEDVELAKYARLNYSSLDKLSGQNCLVFVIEKPPYPSLSEAISYWKKRLDFSLYILWGSKGWTCAKPYDKSEAYDIARQLGIFPHQLPCVVFFDVYDSEDKIVVPIRGALPNFFRNLFGIIQDNTNNIVDLDWAQSTKERIRKFESDDSWSLQNDIRVETVRKLLMAAFDDTDLMALCFDSFYPVYNERFGKGMSKGEKVQSLLDYCVRYGLLEALLELVKDRNPYQYKIYADRIFVK